MQIPPKNPQEHRVVFWATLFFLVIAFFYLLHSYISFRRLCANKCTTQGYHEGDIVFPGGGKFGGSAECQCVSPQIKQ